MTDNIFNVIKNLSSFELSLMIKVYVVFTTTMFFILTERGRMGDA